MKGKGGHRERLKARFVAGGEEAFTDEALLELLLTYAIAQKDVQPLAERLIATFGSLEGVLAADLRALCKQEGIKEHSAVLLKIVNRIRKQGGRVGIDYKANEKVTTPALFPEAARDVTITDTAGTTPSQTKPKAKTVRNTESPSLQGKGTRATTRVPSPHPSHSRPYATSSPQRMKSRDALPRARSGLFTMAGLGEAIHMLPVLPHSSALDDVRSFLRSHLRFSGQTTRERMAQYIAQRMFPDGYADRAMLMLARTYAGRQELRDVCFYRFCKVEPLMYDVVEQLLLPAIGAGQLSRSDLRDYLGQRFPAYSSTNKCGLAIIEALTSAGIADADRFTVNFVYREIKLAALAFILHSEFPEPGMFDIGKLEQSRAVRAMLWKPDALLPALYELRNRGILSKVSEIDAVRQFTTKYTLEQVSELLVKAGSGTLS